MADIVPPHAAGRSSSSSKTLLWILLGVGGLAVIVVPLVLGGATAIVWFLVARNDEPEPVVVVSPDEADDANAAGEADESPRRSPDNDPAVGKLSGPVQITWRIENRTPNCFFFSGPFELGARDHLGISAEWIESGDRVTLKFGDHAFTGRRRAATIELERHSSHEYEGPWRADETIVLEQRGATAKGQYEYHECNLQNAGECPGKCAIVSGIWVALP
jgi:hypothetical protein